MGHQFIIKVLRPFTEQRTQHHYEPGDIVDSPGWDERRIWAYEARGYVERIEVTEPQPNPSQEAEARNPSRGGSIMKSRHRKSKSRDD